MSKVSIRQIDVRFGNVAVLSGLNLEIIPGEFIVLLGPSGCGKSTLLNAIAGLHDVSGGQIWIDNRNVTWDPPGKRGIGMVFQSYALYPRMTVERNLSFSLRMARVPKTEICRRVERVAEVLQIGSLLGRRPMELSGGQRQRVAIGRALVRDVGVFLLDEPLSNLDAKLRTELRVELKQLHKRLKATMVFVTHDQIEAMTLADRVAVMHDGIIQQLDTPREIYRHPKNRFVAAFVGSPAMNFLSGSLRVANGGVQLALRDDTMLSLEGYTFETSALPGRDVSLGLRPEAMSLVKRDGIFASFQAIFTVVEPMGSVSLVWGKVGEETLSVLTNADEDIPLEQSVDVFFRPSEASLFGHSGERI